MTTHKDGRRYPPDKSRSECPQGGVQAVVDNALFCYKSNKSYRECTNCKEGCLDYETAVARVPDLLREFEGYGWVEKCNNNNNFCEMFGNRVVDSDTDDEQFGDSRFASQFID